MELFFQKGQTEVGCDEAGRGCLAGPVYAAAVILNPDKKCSPLVQDSKKLTAEKREKAVKWIQDNALAYGVGYCSPEEIDRWNILQCSFIAMHRAIDQIGCPFDTILVDGNLFKPYKKKRFECMVKGDDRFASIAAASILAKVYRDRYMLEQSELYPQYSWNKNKGYPTKDHISAIETHGISPIHRKSFKVKSKQLKLF